MGRVKKRLLDRLISCETGEIFQAMAVAGYDANHFIKYPRQKRSPELLFQKSCS